MDSATGMPSPIAPDIEAPSIPSSTTLEMMRIPDESREQGWCGLTLVETLLLNPSENNQK